MVSGLQEVEGHSGPTCRAKVKRQVQSGDTDFLSKFQPEFVEKLKDNSPSALGRSSLRLCWGGEDWICGL